MTKDELLIKIDAESKALEKLIQDVNQEIVFRRGRIAALTELLQSLTDQKEGEPDDKSNE